MSNAFIISNARYLVTVNEQNEIKERVSLFVKDGMISAIGDAAKFPSNIPIFDASNHLVMPGLINTHTHLPMTLLRGWAEGVNLAGFLERVWAAEGAIMDAPTCALGAQLGAAEALMGGTTTALDMYFHPVATHQAATGVGLRHIAGPIFLDFTGIDGYEWSQRMDLARQWPAEKAKIPGPHIPLFFMPHSTYTDSPENLAALAALAKEMNARIHIHLSETLMENQEVQTKYGKTPTEILRDTGILNTPTVFGHGIHLSESDIKIALQAKAAIAHNPGSNLKLGSGIADIHHYHSQGLTVGLGTDGCSSSNDLDMWQSMRLAAHLVAYKNSPDRVSAKQIIRHATIEGANAVGLGDRIGSIEVGKEADIIALDLRALHLTPVHDVDALLVFAAGRSDITDVWVAGMEVLKNRVLTKLDIADLNIRISERISALSELKELR